MESDHQSSGEAPPRGVHAMAIVRWVLLALTVLVAVGSWYGFARAELGVNPAPVATMYQCPMHPQIVQDHPGECPICHMTLEPIVKKSAPPATTAPAPLDASPPNVVPIQLALDRVQSIGVRTALVEERTAAPALRVTASVLPTEQGVAQVHVRAPGFVEQISASANQTGLRVGAGQLLFSMYSPEIFQAESELIAASGWTDSTNAADGGSRVALSARRKLELLGMAAKDIDQVIRTKQPLRAVPVYAPAGGIITRKNVVLGSYLTPEMELYELQDFSRVYVVADVFPKDVSAIQVGMSARFMLERRPEAPIDARVDLVYPVVDANARTTRVRLTVNNPARDLRPGDFGTVELAGPPTRVLSVPRDAIVDTGNVAYVFVVGADGVFRPQIVTVAREEGDRALLRTGVSAGDRVVSGATFLIDSESRLQSGLQASADAGHTHP